MAITNEEQVAKGLLNDWINSIAVIATGMNFSNLKISNGRGAVEKIVVCQCKNQKQNGRPPPGSRWGFPRNLTPLKPPDL